MAHDDSAGIEVRVAEPEDGPALIAAIEQIDRETEFLGAADERLPWADAPAAMLGALRARAGGVYLIGCRGADIVGYAGALAGQYRCTRGVLSVPHIGVRQAARRRGVAAGLLAALEAWARAHAAHRIDLTVDETNAAARALYRRAGFAEEGRVRDGALDHGVWRSYVAMAKLLDDGATTALVPDPAARLPRADSLTVTFRTLTPDDAEALRQWEIALLLAPPPLLKSVEEVAAPVAFRAELVAALASPLHFLAAALVGDAIVGLLVVSAKPQARLQADLGLVVNVLAACRGLGIGRRLLAIGEDWARARNAHRLSTAVHAANLPGLRFAAAAGFAPEVMLRRYARFGDRHVDLLGLAKFLDG
jgi:RimJ/RimL family protein N-acetyltransferase